MYNRATSAFNCSLPVSLFSYNDATCMVTISDGKIFSLGLDLEMLMSAGPAELMQFMVDLQSLYCRLLIFPLVTVAAVNGTQNYLLDFELI